MKETNTAAYVQGNFEGQGVSGNVGVRFVQTKGARAELQRRERDHARRHHQLAVRAVHRCRYRPYPWDVLPSANVKFDLDKNLVARLAVSKTMTRADYWPWPAA